MALDVVPTESGFAKTFKLYVRFCFVGVSGIVVDMGLLFILADPKMLAMNLSLSKTLAAFVAIFNNFIWNELWTFREITNRQSTWPDRKRRLIKFYLICFSGIVLSILLLILQVKMFSMNVYLSNFVAIIIVSFWNFGLNVKFGWKTRG